MDKLKVLERLQTLGDVVDEKFEEISVADARKLDRLIEEAFQTVCRRSKPGRA